MTIKKVSIKEAEKDLQEKTYQVWLCETFLMYQESEPEPATGDVYNILYAALHPYDKCSDMLFALKEKPEEKTNLLETLKKELKTVDEFLSIVKMLKEKNKLDIYLYTALESAKATILFMSRTLQGKDS